MMPDLQKNYKLALAVLACLISVVLPFSVQADDKTPSYLLGLGFQFASGTYGTGLRTDTVIAPLTLAVNPTDRLGFSATIPFVYQSNGGVIANLGENNSTSRSKQSQAGLGDIILMGSYVLVPEKRLIPQIRPTLIVKLPTADSDRQLGTGKFDEGVSVEFSKWINRWYTFADAGYVFQGKSARYALKDYVTYNAGVGYQITDKLRPAVTLKGSSAITHGSGSWLEPGVNLFYKFAAHAGIELHLGKGVTRSSPDYNAGLTLLYEF
jgi:hypothetical protein